MIKWRAKSLRNETVMVKEEMKGKQVEEEITSTDILESSCLSVIARKRPLLPYELHRIENQENAVISSSSTAVVPEFDCVSISVNKNSIYLHSEDGLSVDLDIKLKTSSFRVHRCYDEQDECTLYQSLFSNSLTSAIQSPPVQQIAPQTSVTSDSDDVTIIAYGQTGSGKTHTISELTSEAMIDLLSEKTQEIKLIISSFELYGEKCYDLLCSTHDGNDIDDVGKRIQLKVLEDENGNVHTCGATEIMVESIQEGQDVLQRAFASRVTCSTRMNANSSRSHAFFVFKCMHVSSEPSKTIRFIDLAGNERWEDAIDHDKYRIEEMKAINYSLGNMKECFRKMIVNKGGSCDVGHMPYRRSKLTMLLKNVLLDEHSSNKKRKAVAIFVAHLAPLRSSLKHNENTCQFVSSLLEKITRAEKEQSNFTGPLQWSKQEMMNFVKGLEDKCGYGDGRFVNLSESFQLTGKLFSTEWIGDVEKRVVAAGGTKSDANDIYDSFHDLVKRDKARRRKTATASSKIRRRATPPMVDGSGSASASSDSPYIQDTNSTKTSSIRKQMMAKFADSFNKDDCVVLIGSTSKSEHDSGENTHIEDSA